MSRTTDSVEAAGAVDPRIRVDGLGWVTRALFADERLRVSVSRRSRPGEQCWAIVPSVERARFLVPLGNRRAAASSMLAYNALRSGPTRAVRAAIGALARLGATEALHFPVLRVHTPPDSGDLTPIDHLATAMNEPSLIAAIGVRPPDPNRKPTLQLFDGRGRPRGYAKIGWNGATRELVRAESAALLSLPADPGGDYPITPRPSYRGDWGDRVIGVTAPLPEKIRRLSDPDRPRVAAILAVARRGGAPGERRLLAGSPFLLRLRTEAETVAGPDGVAIRAAVDGLSDRTGAVEMEFGVWHGDWVPWNLAELDVHGATRLVAWDFEHSGAPVPVGFDLAHQAFNTALVVGGRNAAGAVSLAGEALGRHGTELGLEPGAAELILDAYLAEMWLRTCRMAAGGAGWNTDLHPALLEVLNSGGN
ncbi:hypothetical protein ACWKSP_28190 [Micromonosporaceae bacterium Da 78-11]